MSKQLINSVGLACDIVGALLIWQYGLPAEFDPQGRQFIATSDLSQQDLARGKRFRLLSSVGVALLVGGFTLQLMSNFVP